MKPADNTSFVLKTVGQFEYETRQPPALPSDRHVRIRVKATGIW